MHPIPVVDGYHCWQVPKIFKSYKQVPNGSDGGKDIRDLDWLFERENPL